MLKAKCYLAGPMSSYPMHNFPAFFTAEKALRDTGWTVLNPARMDQEANFDPDKWEKKGRSPVALREVVRRDVVAILSLRVEDGDALVLMPHWQWSFGARAEWALAKWLGLDVYELESACK